MSTRGGQGSTGGAGTVAVMVCAGATPYLPDALRALGEQTMLPDVLVVVDVASRDNGLGDGTPVEEVVSGTGLDQRLPVRVVHCSQATGFRDAVSQGLEAYTSLVAAGNRRRSRSDSSTSTTGTGLGTLRGPTGALSPITDEERLRLAPAAEQEAPAGPAWLWLLHDDCAPQAQCLELLVEAMVTSRSVALAGPKQVDWDHPECLLEVGLTTTASARRANEIVEGEIDQGQYDDRSDVLAVGSAGALIDRQVWEQVGGPCPLFPLYGDGLELSRAVRLAGHRVVVAPKAHLRHRRASLLGLRPPTPVTDLLGATSTQSPEPDPDRSFRARRIAQLSAWAAFSAGPLRPLLVYFLVLAVARGAWRLLAKAPQLAVDEWQAALEVVRKQEQIKDERSRLAGVKGASRALLAELYTTATEIRAQRRDRHRQLRERAARAAAPSELELLELTALRRTRRVVLAGVLLVTLLAGSFMLSKVLVTRVLGGGALPAAGLSVTQAWDAAWSTWAGVGDGLPTVPSPLMALLAAVLVVSSPLGLGAQSLVSLLLHLSVPLAAVGAWYAAGAVTRRPALRAWAALTWAGAPALLLAVGQGRLPAVLVHLLLPWAMLALARALGVDRRDVILSGMVGAKRSKASARGAVGQDDLPAPGAEGARRSRGPVDDDPAIPVTDDVKGARVSASTRRGARIRAAATEQYGPGSVSAAAAAGLLAACVTAADAAVGLALTVLLTALVVLVRLKAPARGARRLLLTLVPVLAVGLPTWWHALGMARGEGGLLSVKGWMSFGHHLLATAGTPVAVPPPSSAELLLGLPTSLSGLGLGTTATLLVLLALALSPAMSMLAVTLPAGHGARARAGLVLALAGLVTAHLALRTTAGLGTDPAGLAGVVSVTATVPGWAGAGATLLQAGLLLAALSALDHVNGRLVHHPFGWRHISAAGLSVVMVLVCLTSVSAWAWTVRANTSGYAMMLRPGGSTIPAIAMEMQRTTGGRVLQLGVDPQGVNARLLRSDGTSLADVSPAANQLAASRITAVPGAQEEVQTRPAMGLWGPGAGGAQSVALRDDPSQGDLAQLVVKLVSGQDETVAGGLARHGVSVVLLTDLSDHATEVAAGVDATPDVEPLSVTAKGRSWRVNPPGDQEVSGAVLATAEQGSGDFPSSFTFLPWAAASLSTDLGPADNGAERVLYLAERADPGWVATLDGTRLRPVPDPAGWRQAFAVPAGGGRLEVRHESLQAKVMNGVTLLVLGVTALAAVPLRRRKDGL